MTELTKVGPSPIQSQRDGHVPKLDNRKSMQRRTHRWIAKSLVCTLLIVAVGHNLLFLTGYRYVTTTGDSMEPTIAAGSLLLTRRTAPEDIRPGNIIAFRASWDGGSLILHRVVALLRDDGALAVVTQGDNNPVPDPELLTLDGPLPQAILKVPYLGR